MHAFVALDCTPVHAGHQDDGEDVAIEAVPKRKIAEQGYL